MCTHLRHTCAGPQIWQLLLLPLGPLHRVDQEQHSIAQVMLNSETFVCMSFCYTCRSPDMAVAVAAIRALTGVIKNSTAQTMMGLEKELKDAAAALQRWAGL